MNAMDTKILWLDTETTGKYDYVNDVIQIGAIVEIGGKVIDQANIRMQPTDWTKIQQEALDVNGLTIDILKTYQTSYMGLAEFTAFMSKHVDQYNKQDKFIMAGYNTPFDHGFIRQLFKKNGHRFFGSFFEYKMIDVYQLVILMALHYNWEVPNHKLSTMADFFNIPINAHDAMSDITATRDLFHHLKSTYLKEM